MGAHVSMPKVGVVYGQGAVGPVDIFAGAQGAFDLRFIFDANIPDVAGQRAILTELGPVIDITSQDDATAAQTLTDCGIRHLSTFSEHSLVRTAEIAAAAGINFSSPAAIHRGTNKAAQRDALAAAGLEHVRHCLVENPDQLLDALAAVGLPAVVKPVAGAGSRDTIRIDRIDEATRLVKEFGHGEAGRRMIVEELLHGDESQAGAGWGDYVSVEAAVQGGVSTPICVTGKFPLAEPFRETGVIIPCTLTDDACRQAIDLADAAVRALGITEGITHTELKLTSAGPRIIEVNVRVGGYVPQLLERSTGFSLVRAALQLAVGDSVVVPELTFGSVEFIYFIQPPVGATRLVDTDGVTDLRKIPGVFRVKNVKRAGDRVDSRLGTTEHVAVINASAGSHVEAQHIVSQVNSTAHFTYA